MRLGRASTIALATAASMLACQVLVGIEPEEGAPEPADAAPAPPPDAELDASCALLHPPPPPTDVAPVPDASTAAYFFAMRAFGVRPFDRPPYGYDLDNACTTQNTGATCVGTSAPDDDGGLDNAAGRTLDDLASDNPDFVATGFQSSVEKGTYTLLVQLTAYNGTPNDDDVKVGILTGTRIVDDDAGCPRDPSVDAGRRPLWDGCDRWEFEPMDAGIENISLTYMTLNGYVTDGTLVAKGYEPGKPPRTLSFGTREGQLELGTPVLTAKIQTNDAGVLVLEDGVIAGRASPRSLFGFIRRLEIQPNVYVCNADFPFQGVVATICAFRDVRFDPTSDGKGEPCDAISLAFGFRAERAAIGGPFPRVENACDGSVPACR